MRTLFATIMALTLTASPLWAGCDGENLIDAMKPADRDQITKTAAQDPYSRGNMWRATKGDHQINLISTIHLHDVRLTEVTAALSANITASDLVMLELTKEDMMAFGQGPAKSPQEYFILDGPTFPEFLPKEKWVRLSEALRARGVPPMLAAQFRPWYMNVIMMTPPCVMADAVAQKHGLDMMIYEVAKDADIPIQSLDNLDALLDTLQEGTREEHLKALDMNLAVADRAPAQVRTTVDAYFNEEIGLNWAFSKFYFENEVELPVAEKAKAWQVLEGRLLNDRNTAWMEKILPASAEHEVITVAVGALHMVGERGLPNLLAQEGYHLERVQTDAWQQ